VRKPIKRVLVAVKPRQKGLPLAADHARMLAEQLGAELVLFRAVHDSALAFRLVSEQGNAAAVSERVLEAERADLERLAELLRAWGVAVQVEVRWGAPPFEVIVQAVEDLGIDLVLVGVHESRPVLHTRLTDTDWQLMRLCPCPVLIVKDPEFRAHGTVLAAVDPLHPAEEIEPTDRAVLEAAAALAGALGGELMAVHAYPDPAQYSWVSAVEVAPGVFYGTENIETVHREAVQALVEEYGIAPDRIVLAPGDARLVIPEAAAERDAQILVIGVLKRGEPAQAALLGSTAESVIRDAACNVLMVKP
jgi:universal stress protein E